MKKLIGLLVLLIFVFGCITPSIPNENTFKLEEIFAIKEGQTFSEEKEKFTVKAVGFSDSRCPADKEDKVVNCFWEGELRVALEIKNLDKKKTIYLGAVTKLKETFSSYEIELISIDFDKKTAKLKITEINSTNKAWFSIEPIQCQLNQWNNWSKAEATYFDNELDYLKAWLNIEHNVKVYEIQSKHKHEAVCEACGCSTGNIVAVLVGVKDKEKMIELGWKEMNIECAKEAKHCPDGSAIERIIPFCDFEECPAN